MLTHSDFQEVHFHTAVGVVALDIHGIIVFSNPQFRHFLSGEAHLDQGEILLWVGTSTDIEEQKKNEQRKDEFLSIASHELKTPLTNIKAFNQIMARSTTEGNITKFITPNFLTNPPSSH